MRNFPVLIALMALAASAPAPIRVRENPAPLRIRTPEEQRKEQAMNGVIPETGEVARRVAVDAPVKIVSDPTAAATVASVAPTADRGTGIARDAAEGSALSLGPIVVSIGLAIIAVVGWRLWASRGTA